MNIAFVTAILTLLGQIIPALNGDNSKIANIITILEQIVSGLVKLGMDLAPTIQNIIEALRGSDGITSAQLDQLDALEVQIDAAYDQAVADFDAQNDSKPTN